MSCVHIHYSITYINIKRKTGPHNRIKELFLGDISGKTQIVFTIDGQPPDPVGMEHISTIDEEGVRALNFVMNTTQPRELYNQFCESAFELSKEVR